MGFTSRDTPQEGRNCKISQKEPNKRHHGSRAGQGLIKIAINNVSGIGIRTNKLQRVLEWMGNHQYDILMAQEANASFKHQQVQHYQRQTLRSQFHITTSETEFRFKHPTKPGGTFILTNRKISYHIVQKIHDLAGEMYIRVR